MDNLGGLLDAPRARGAFALRAVMQSPWSLRILAESPLTLIAGVVGECWIVPDQGDAVRVGPGDTVACGAVVGEIASSGCRKMGVLAGTSRLNEPSCSMSTSPRIRRCASGGGTQHAELPGRIATG